MRDWILCSCQMPEEYEWIGTKSFGTTKSEQVIVTFETPGGKRFIKILSFQNGEIAGLEKMEIDAIAKGSIPIAWMPLPEPYRGDKSGTIFT